MSKPTPKKPIVAVEKPAQKKCRFLGTYARSNKGCAVCRRRKKKCDEAHPRCGFCTERNIDCVWPPIKPRKKYERRKKLISELPTSVSSTVLNPTIPLPNFKEDEKRATSYDLVGSYPSSSFANDDLIHQDPENIFYNSPGISLHDFFSSLSPASEGSMTPVSKSNYDFSNVFTSLYDNKVNLEDIFPYARMEDLDKEKEEDQDYLPILKQLIGGVELILKDYPKHIIKLLLDKSPSSPKTDPWSSIQDVEVSLMNMLNRLTKTSFKYLEYYIFRFTDCLSISPVSSNYMVKTFLPLAFHNEGILNALVAWGCLMYYSPVDARLYLNKATKFIYKSYANEAVRTPEDTFIFLSFVLILSNFEVCAGDTQNWYILLKECKNIIDINGGLVKISNLYSNSNDIKWLISNFQIHDMLASSVNYNGTLYSPQEYAAVLVDDVSYGLDPLQGCIRPLYSIIGEVGSKYAELRKQLEVIESLKLDNNSINMKRLEYYEKCEEIAKNFEERVESTSPNLELLALTKAEDSRNTAESHMTLFELYSYVCHLYIGMYIRQLPPNSFRQQSLVIKSLELIDIILKTPMFVSLPFLFFITGINCYRESDKGELRMRMKEYTKIYNLANFQRMRTIIEDCWKVNPTGSRVVDWSELANKRNWNLYAG